MLLVDERGILRGRRMQLAAEERRDLAREADHREQVDPIHGRNHVEHLVPDRDYVAERRPRLRTVREQHDSRVVVPEADLVLGQDHPPRRLAAELALVEGLVEDRQERTGKRDGDGRAGFEVPRPADDLARVALAHVDLAEPQAIGVRMGDDLEDASDEEAAEVAVDVRHADLDHALDLESRDREPVRDLVRGRVDGDVLAQPGERRPHQNCSRSRGSLRQSSRRSGIPWRKTAIRSRPHPKANPVYRSAS